MKQKSKIGFFKTVILLAIIILSSCGTLGDEHGDLNKRDLRAIENLNKIAPASLPAGERAQLILDKMTLREKCAILAGINMSSKTFTNLGLRQVVYADSAQGVRTYWGATAFPSGISTAATWNRDLAYALGDAIGKEALLFGVDYILGPGINLYRLPTCGRNFEYLGEDPVLAGGMASEFVKGLQRNNVAATVKHFAANNQEYDRHCISSDIDEDVLQMLYFPAFKKVLQEAKCASLMTSYNLVNGVSASENQYLIKETLRKDWGFNGVVMTDWSGSYSTFGMMKADLDLEMPWGTHYNYKKINALLKKGEITIEDVDAKVLRLLETNLGLGIYDRARPIKNPSYDNPVLVKNREIAKQMAIESLVLLKNENLLPLENNSDGYILVLGPNAVNTEINGGGASYVVPVEKIDILDGIKKYSNKEIVYLDLKNNILTEDNHKLVEEADAVIVSLGLDKNIEKEDLERYWELPEDRRHKIQSDDFLNQESLVKSLIKLNKNTCAILTVGGGVKLKPWLDDLAAIIHSLYGGQFIGEAVARAIFGIDNPSGKLPFSMAKEWEDFEASKYYVKDDDIVKWGMWNYPFQNAERLKKKTRSMAYGERFGIGYRNFIKNNIEPLYAFGYGLSYTSFELKDFDIREKDDIIKISLKVKNTGDRAGAEVVQIYVQSPTYKEQSPLDLRDFEKVYLEAGESKNIEFSIDKKDLEIFDIEERAWELSQGEYVIKIGNSSDNFVFTKKLNF